MFLLILLLLLLLLLGTYNPGQSDGVATIQKYLGEIPQVKETYNVVGNGNEYGLVIGESTFGGVEELASQPGAIIDYGSLIYLTLQRAKTAREAIETMADLMGECVVYTLNTVVQWGRVKTVCVFVASSMEHADSMP